jgi:hypothetical protein
MNSCWIATLAHSPPDLSRRHHLHTFSQNLLCGWEDIWRKVVHVLKLSGQCFFKYFANFFVSISRRHCQNSKMAMLGLNELKPNVEFIQRRFKNRQNRPLLKAWKFHSKRIFLQLGLKGLIKVVVCISANTCTQSSNVSWLVKIQGVVYV